MCISFIITHLTLWFIRTCWALLSEFFSLTISKNIIKFRQKYSNRFHHNHLPIISNSNSSQIWSDNLSAQNTVQPSAMVIYLYFLQPINCYRTSQSSPPKTKLIRHLQTSALRKIPTLSSHCHRSQLQQVGNTGNPWKIKNLSKSVAAKSFIWMELDMTHIKVHSILSYNSMVLETKCWTLCDAACFHISHRGIKWYCGMMSNIQTLWNLWITEMSLKYLLIEKATSW